MSHDTLREQIRTAIIDGSLPRSGGKPRIFGGRGEWQTCSCCHETINPAEVQYDVDCSLNGMVHVLSMHLKCFQAWELESRSLAGIAGHSVCEDAA